MARDYNLKEPEAAAIIKAGVGNDDYWMAQLFEVADKTNTLRCCTYAARKTET